MLLPIQLNLQPLAQVAWLQVAPARTLTAAAGAFALTGVAAGLSQGGSPASAQVSWLQVASVRALAAAPGAFALTGVAAGLLAGGSAQAWVSWLQLAPPGAGAYTLTADSGSFLVSVAPSLSPVFAYGEQYAIAPPCLAFDVRSPGCRPPALRAGTMCLRI